MGTQVHETKRDPAYPLYVVWRDEAGRKQNKGFRTTLAAHEFAADHRGLVMASRRVQAVQQ